MSRSRFIQREKAVSPIVVLCRVRRVARAAYDAWARRGASARAQVDAQLATQIAAAHERSRRTYGAPRIHAALRAAGTHTSRRRVARLMRGWLGGLPPPAARANHAGLRRPPFTPPLSSPQSGQGCCCKATHFHQAGALSSAPSRSGTR